MENLESIGLDDTVHDIPDMDSCSTPPLPGKVEVDKEDVILGERVSMVYHVCLQQLAEYLTLPISHCPTSQCGVPGPYHVKCKERGTAIILEWVSLQYRSLVPLVSYSKLHTHTHTLTLYMFFYVFLDL